MATHSVRSRGPSPRRLGYGNPRPAEEIHDPYRTTRKAKTPARCAECGATYLKGRWTWARLRPQRPATLACPACRRVRDKVPAGELILRGTFLAERVDEAVRIVRNVEVAERKQHPLNRIMALRRGGGELKVQTTDLHLPRRMAHALESAWRGETTTHYDEQGCFVRVVWERND